MPKNLNEKLIQARNRVQEKPNLHEMKLDLKLNLSPPRIESPSPSMTTSPASSCVSSELSQSEDSLGPEVISMMLVGCPRCLMYVMLAKEDPKCPKCKSTVLLDVIHENNCKTTVKKTSTKS